MLNFAGLRLSILTLASATALTLAVPAFAGPMAGVVDDGWYARGEVGAQMLAEDRGFWWGPGGPPGDPRITFSLQDARSITGAAAIGYDWMNGFRTDLSLMLNGSQDITADILSASDSSPIGDHASRITTSVWSQAVLANAFFEPMKAMGNNGPVQPFLTAGIGIANVSMGEWTREHPSKSDRTFEGASRVNLAWTLGAGVSFALGDLAGGHPVFMDLTYRYADLGKAQGSAAAVDKGASAYEAFNFENTSHTVTIGLRVPFGNN
ncbi:MAG TPA: hypothetical protein VIL84_06295 [Devosiaceae bacterium]